MRHYFMELVGTFFLTVAITTGDPLAIGLMLMSMIYVGGHISGAHFNPALSLAALMRGKMRTDDFFIYVAMQSVGAGLAIWLYRVVTNTLYAPQMPGVQLPVAIATEALLTVVLCLVFLTFTGKRYKESALGGLAIGLALTAIATIGGLFNPAVAIGSVVGKLATGGAAMCQDIVLLYIGGPLAGAALAVFLYQYLEK